MNVQYQLKRTRDVIRSLPMLIAFKKHDRWTREKLEAYQS